MTRYPPTGYIVFSLKKLKLYGGRGAGGHITQIPYIFSLSTLN